MNHRQAVAAAIKSIRQQRKLTQEEFSVVSSRTYLSTLERALKSPTLEKLGEIANVLDVSAATIVLVAHAIQCDNKSTDESIQDVVREAKKILAEMRYPVEVLLSEAGSQR